MAAKGLSVQCVHAVSILRACCVHAVCMLCIVCMHSPCQLHLPRDKPQPGNHQCQDIAYRPVMVLDVEALGCVVDRLLLQTVAYAARETH